ncbi:MAG: LptF/LptG family permease [Chthoniobacterales bacterium]
MSLLDRYVLKKFIVPFFYCFFGFIAIWLVFDLSDNGPDFIAGKAPLPLIFEFYLSQIPEIVVISLPVGTLLALLYSLTQMSRSNEIISMLGSGRSVSRILMPLFAFGLLLVGITAYFNYEGAPHAAATKKALLKEINSGKKRESAIVGHLYRNRQDDRTWYSRKIRMESNAIDDVQIIQQDPEGVPLKQWYARDAVYDDARQAWNFVDLKYVEMDAAGDVTKTQFHKEFQITGWSETPERIASSRMVAEYLSVPELKDYLSYNSDFPPARLAPFETNLQYRYALPWVCILVVFLAAPMGIVYSRRGILGGVAIAITLFFLLVFCSSLAIALGKGDRISPVAAAWGPLVVFLGIGFILLWYRSTNRDIPIPKLFG